MRLLPVLISAIMFTCSSPGLSTQYMIFIALIPFFVVLIKSVSLRQAALAGAVFGAVLSTIQAYPLFQALSGGYGKGIFLSSLLILLTVLIPYSLLYGSFGALFRLFSRNFSGPGILIPPSLWILADYAAEYSGLFIPWVFPGYSLVFTPIIQIADLTGIYGVTFAAVLVNTAASLPLSSGKQILKACAVTAAVIIPAALYGILHTDQYRNISGQQYNALIVQGNFSTEERWASSSSEIRYMTYTKLTEKNSPGSDIVIWPETVLNSSDNVNYRILQQASAVLGKDVLLIAGGTRKDRDGNSYNSIFIQRGEKLVSIYDKQILFPYSESSFAGMSAGSFQDSPALFRKGSGRNPVRTGSVTPGLSICFEALYPSYIRKTVSRGADILVNAANDSWFPGKSEPEHHLYRNIARAVENRRFLLRASNTGISAIITPAGEIAASADINTRTVIRGKVTGLSCKSFYTKHGDLIVAAAALIIMSASLAKIFSSGRTS